MTEIVVGVRVRQNCGPEIGPAVLKFSLRSLAAHGRDPERIFGGLKISEAPSKILGAPPWATWCGPWGARSRLGNFRAALKF